MDSTLDVGDFILTIMGTGQVLVDDSSTRLILGLLMVETLLLIGILIFFLVYLFKKSFRTRGTAIDETKELIRQTEKTRQQLDEMVQKTNERNNYINSIFSSIDDGFMLVDSSNQVVLYNPKALELLKLDPKVFFPQHAHHILSQEPVASVIAICEQVLKNKTPEHLVLETEEHIILDVQVSPLIDKYKRSSDIGALALVKNITELRKLENLKKDFVANVSHEFRTPLTVISGFLEMFSLNECITPEDRQRAIEIITIETERLKRLVSELLSLSAIENSLPNLTEGRIDVRKSLEEVVSSLSHLAGNKSQQLYASIDFKQVILFGNENWFYLAVKNVVENAIKYTGKRGSIKLHAFVENAQLHISVTDTGIGIPPEELEKIFERFYRIEKARGSGSGGSGLGLSLVKDIVSLFKGTVTVSSELSKGTSFIISMPLPCEPISKVEADSAP